MLQLYKNIRKRRQELGLTQNDLAKLVGYSGKSMIARIEKGDVDLPADKIMTIAEAGVPLEAISRRLGHADSAVTKNVYLHITEKMVQKDNEAYERMIL